MADLETSIAFGYGSLELEDAALPSVTRVVEMLRRHTALTLSIEPMGVDRLLLAVRPAA